MRRFALGAIAALFLAGCTTYAPTPSTTVDAQQIMYTIISELYCAALEIPAADTEPPPGRRLEPEKTYFASYNNWVVGIDLYLSASIEASVSPSVSLLGPFTLAKAVPPGGTVGSFTSAFGGSFDQTRTNLREYKIYLFMPLVLLGTKADQAGPAQNPEADQAGPAQNPDLKSSANEKSSARDWGKFTGVDCATNSGGIYDRKSGSTYLIGRLGLKDWLVPAVYTQEATKQYAPPPKDNGKGSGPSGNGSGSALTLMPPYLPHGQSGKPYTADISVKGGTAPYTFLIAQQEGGGGEVDCRE
jgi:hypothetical protein